jgi:hypothetical protein
LTYTNLIIEYNTTVFGVLRWCDKGTFTDIRILVVSIYQKLHGLTVLSVLNMKILYTKPPPFDFLKLYGLPAGNDGGPPKSGGR